MLLPQLPQRLEPIAADSQVRGHWSSASSSRTRAGRRSPRAASPRRRLGVRRLRESGGRERVRRELGLAATDVPAADPRLQIDVILGRN